MKLSRWMIVVWAVSLVPALCVGGDEPGGKDFSRGDWRKRDFSGQRLDGASFENADAQAADFTGARLTGANFRNADLTRANFSRAVLAGADLRGAKLQFAQTWDADLSGVNLAGADLTNVRLGRLSLRNANLSGLKAIGNCETVDFRGANLTGADLLGFADAGGTPSKWNGAFFDRATKVPEGLDLKARGAILTENGVRPPAALPAEGPTVPIAAGKDFRGKTLRKRVFRSTDLAGASFQDADLKEATFERVRAGGASFVGADLASATFQGACDLGGADFQGAYLTSAAFHDADLSGARLRRQNLSRVYLNRVKLAGADLREVDAVGTVASCDFSKADLRGADLSGLREQGVPPSDFRGAIYDDQTRWPEGFDPDVAGAVKAAPEAPPAAPGGPGALEAAKALMGEGQFAEAADAFRAILRIDPREKAAWQGLSNALRALGKSEESARAKAMADATPATREGPPPALTREQKRALGEGLSAPAAASWLSDEVRALGIRVPVVPDAESAAPEGDGAGSAPFVVHLDVLHTVRCLSQGASAPLQAFPLGGGVVQADSALAALRRVLQEADRSAGPRGANGASPLRILVHADASAPWQEAQWILAVCPAAAVAAGNVFLVVARSGGDEVPDGRIRVSPWTPPKETEDALSALGERGSTGTFPQLTDRMLAQASVLPILLTRMGEPGARGRTTQLRMGQDVKFDLTGVDAGGPQAEAVFQGALLQVSAVFQQVRAAEKALGASEPRLLLLRSQRSNDEGVPCGEIARLLSGLYALGHRPVFLGSTSSPADAAPGDPSPVPQPPAREHAADKPTVAVSGSFDDVHFAAPDAGRWKSAVVENQLVFQLDVPAPHLLQITVFASRPFSGTAKDAEADLVKDMDVHLEIEEATLVNDGGVQELGDKGTDAVLRRTLAISVSGQPRSYDARAFFGGGRLNVVTVERTHGLPGETARLAEVDAFLRSLRFELPPMSLLDSGLVGAYELDAAGSRAYVEDIVRRGLPAGEKPAQVEARIERMMARLRAATTRLVLSADYTYTKRMTLPPPPGETAPVETSESGRWSHLRKVVRFEVLEVGGERQRPPVVITGERQKGAILIGGERGLRWVASR